MPRIDDYKAAIVLAAAELQNVNPKRLAGLSRCEYFYTDNREWLLVPFFGQDRRVLWPEVSVTPAEGEGEVPLTEQILILHYLLHTTGEPLSGRDIDFRSVPEGGFYWSAFVSRAKKPLIETFGNDLDLYLEVAASLGGTPRNLGDASATFMAFPLVPVTHVLWRGDEEFPPDANLLFDETISKHLSTEDIAALAGSSVYRLMGAAHKMRKSH
jgi:hypothetical protein